MNASTARTVRLTAEHALVSAERRMKGSGGVRETPRPERVPRAPPPGDRISSRADGGHPASRMPGTNAAREFQSWVHRIRGREDRDPPAERSTLVRRRSPRTRYHAF